MKMIRFEAKSTMDWKSIEGKKVLQGIFQELFSEQAWKSKKKLLDEWTFAKNNASSQGIDRVQVLDGLKELERIGFITYIHVARVSVSSRNIKITDLGYNGWIKHINREEPVEELVKGDMTHRTRKHIFSFVKRLRKTDEEVKEIARDVVGKGSLTEFSEADGQKAVLSLQKLERAMQGLRRLA